LKIIFTSNLNKFIGNFLLFIFLFISIHTYAQIVPYSFVQNNSFTPTIYQEASFKLNASGSIIKSNFNWDFNQDKSYTIQFLFKRDSYSYTFNQGFLGFTSFDAGLVKPSVLFYEWDFYYGTIKNYIDFDYLNNEITESGPDPINKELKLNVAYHITTTYDGIRWKNYRNGILINSTLNNNTEWGGSSNLIIGNNGGETNMTFDEVRFWDRALTADEITKNWNKSLSGYEAGLKVYYNFDHQGYPNSNNLKISSLNDVTNENNASFINTVLNGNNNNFVSTTANAFTYTGNLNFPIFNFNAINIDSYPGTNKNNNPTTYSRWYNLNGFDNNLIFYTNTNYNQFKQPIYFADGVRSIGVHNIFGKSKFNYDISRDSSLSIETWVKFKTNNNNSIVMIGSNSERNKFEIGVTSNKFSINIGGNHTLLSNNSMISNKWYHLVYAYSNKTLKYKIYINGILDKDEWIDPIIGYVDESVNFWEGLVGVRHNIPNTPIYIGTSQTPFNGNLALLNVYDRVLSESEIQKRFRVSKARFGY